VFEKAWQIVSRQHAQVVRAVILVLQHLPDLDIQVGVVLIRLREVLWFSLVRIVAGLEELVDLYFEVFIKEIKLYHPVHQGTAVLCKS